MNIKNRSWVSYIKDEKILKQKSNVVITKVIKPIICFEKMCYMDKIKVYIKNTSGTSVKNIIYKECIDTKETEVTINGTISKIVNLYNGIKLGKLNNNEFIYLEYQSTSYSPSLLYYEINIDSNKNKIYLIKR